MKPQNEHVTNIKLTWPLELSHPIHPVREQVADVDRVVIHRAW